MKAINRYEGYQSPTGNWCSTPPPSLCRKDANRGKFPNAQTLSKFGSGVFNNWIKMASGAFRTASHEHLQTLVRTPGEAILGEANRNLCLGLCTVSRLSQPLVIAEEEILGIYLARRVPAPPPSRL
jgi:hypothetical protein